MFTPLFKNFLFGNFHPGELIKPLFEAIVKKWTSGKIAKTEGHFLCKKTISAPEKSGALEKTA